MLTFLEYLLYLSVLVQIIYYAILVLRYIFARQATKIDNIHHSPVSVIICARNESVNLQNNLTFILEQEYPDFEVLVVNDASEDDTALILNTFQNRYAHLRVLHLTAEQKLTIGKKGALQHGIEHAKNEYLLMTDADCIPQSKKWIQSMVNHFNQDVELVLGISPYKRSGSFLQEVVHFETITTLIQYVGWALWKMPYMGVGRSIAYTKSLFEKVGGFKDHIHLVSGDDDLFVQQAIQYTQTKVCVDPEAYMWSIPPSNWNQWWNQKIRHYSVGGSYRFLHQMVLGSFIATKALVYILIFLFIVTNHIHGSLYWSCLIYLIGVYLLYGWFMHKSMLKVRWHLLIILDIVFIGTILAQGLSSKIFRKTLWE